MSLNPTASDNLITTTGPTPHLNPQLRPLFLVWGAPHGSHRSQWMASELGMEIKHVYLTLKQGKWQALLKYPAQTFQSLAALIRQRPRLIFVQNPPIFASLVVYLYTLLTGARFVIDSHTDALLASWWAWSLPLHRFLSGRAVTTLVTNEHLYGVVAAWPARAFILADPPTTYPQRQQAQLDRQLFNLVFVSSASYDEPVREVFKAAERLPEAKIYITGNYAKLRPNLIQIAPPNVQFTGFVPDEAFYGLLEAADAVMSLTTEDHTIQSGAAEALWLGRPIITSDWPLLRSYFNRGTLHVDNTAESIYQAILTIKANPAQFLAEIRALQQERRAEWQQRAAELIKLLDQAI